MSSPLSIKGFQIFPDHLDRSACEALVRDLRAVARLAPFRVPVTPSGKAMSVRMTSAGRVGWITDRSGYRYEDAQPSGEAWPPVPDRLLQLWRDVTGLDRDPDCCLVNYYGEDAKMGLHQDRDEGDFQWPVVSVSLGDEALFRMGNPTRGGSTESVWLKSGAVVVMGGAARLAYHGIDRIRFGSSSLLRDGGRINVTLRVVDQSGASM